MDPAAYDSWYKTPRGRWIGDAEFRLLRDMLQPESGATLLDIGCGTGYFTRRFALEVELSVAGADLNTSWLKFAALHGAGERYVAADAARLPFPDGAFDYTLSVTALCFVADERRAIREMLRVTRKRFAIGLLNRHSLLFLQKGINGGKGAYRGARWHTAGEVRALFRGMPVTGLAISSAIYCPSGGVMARSLEEAAPPFLPWGGFIAVTGIVRES